MRTIAIDPGYGRCGVAVLDQEGSSVRLVYSDCIETSAQAPFADRLNEVARECARLMDLHAPDHVAIEKLFFTKNQKTAMHVAEVRGALLNEAAGRGLRVFEYGPGEVKSAVAGYGGADKRAVSRMIDLLVKIDKRIKHDDEYDAIAIGVTHFALARSRT